MEKITIIALGISNVAGLLFLIWAVYIKKWPAYWQYLDNKDKELKQKINQNETLEFTEEDIKTVMKAYKCYDKHLS